MGGLILLTSGLVPTLLWTRLDNPYVVIALARDGLDGRYRVPRRLPQAQAEARGRENDGLVERYKLAGQVTIGLVLGIFLWQAPALDAARRVDHAAVLQVRPRRPGRGRRSRSSTLAG